MACYIASFIEVFIVSMYVHVLVLDDYNMFMCIEQRYKVLYKSICDS